jgi:dipicolinate synthase subunit B
MKKLITKNKAIIIPIMSYNSYNLDTKFGKAEDFIKEIKEATGKKIIHTIQEAEPIGPKDLLDILIIAPCSGNTISKLANDVIDGPVTMAVKSHLRRERPVVIAVSTNNALSRKCRKYWKIT